MGRAWERLASDDRMTTVRPHRRALAGAIPMRRGSRQRVTIPRHGHDTRDVRHPLAQNEEYTQASAMDALLRFEDSDSCPSSPRPSAIWAPTHLSAPGPLICWPRAGVAEGVLDTLMAGAEETHEARITVACLTGAMSNDWASAMQLVERLCGQTTTCHRRNAPGCGGGMQGPGDHEHPGWVEQGRGGKESPEAHRPRFRHHGSPADRCQQP